MSCFRVFLRIERKGANGTRTMHDHQQLIWGAKDVADATKAAIANFKDFGHGGTVRGARVEEVKHGETA